MSIAKDEIEPDKKIVVSKVQFSCDMIDESIPRPLFQNYNSFLILSACDVVLDVIRKMNDEIDQLH
eukprot:SAG11_NODE_15711_length_568_cov_3.144989_1_plen_66_part_00